MLSAWPSGAQVRTELPPDVRENTVGKISMTCGFCFAHRLATWIPGLDRIRRQGLRRVQRGSDPGSAWLGEQEELGDVMALGEVDLVTHQQGFEGLLGSLLGMKARDTPR